MTPDEMEAQRRSFAYGNANLANPNVTRAMVDDAAVQTVTLERIQVAIANLVTDYPELERAEVDLHWNMMAKTWAVKLRRYIAVLPDQKVTWPADWWQAVRARFAPKWWLRRHPVVYAEAKVFKAVCPHLHMDPPEDHVKFFFMPEAMPELRWPRKEFR